MPPSQRDWLKVSPDGFERIVVAELRQLGKALKSFQVEHQAVLATPEGEFTMDAMATFEALGSDFLVLVECKHHKNPIKRELVQVLSDKLTSSHAQKAMLFSTAPFQSGALELAAARRIALIHVTEGGPVWETKGAGGPTGPNRAYDAHWVTMTDSGGVTYRFGGYEALATWVFDAPA
ncbi:MAG: restriction endonuclease [Coriobacteriia bacterium]